MPDFREVEATFADVLEAEKRSSLERIEFEKERVQWARDGATAQRAAARARAEQLLRDAKAWSEQVIAEGEERLRVDAAAVDLEWRAARGRQERELAAMEERRRAAEQNRDAAKLEIDARVGQVAASCKRGVAEARARAEEAEASSRERGEAADRREASAVAAALRSQKAAEEKEARRMAEADRRLAALTLQHKARAAQADGTCAERLESSRAHMHERKNQHFQQWEVSQARQQVDQKRIALGSTRAPAFTEEVREKAARKKGMAAEIQRLTAEPPGSGRRSLGADEDALGRMQELLGSVRRGDHVGEHCRTVL